MSIDYISKDEVVISKSPFAKFLNEEKIYDGRSTPISLEHIMYKVKRGYVEEFDFLILEIVGLLGFATSKMVAEYLEYMGYDKIPQMKVSARLKFLTKINILGRYKFVTDGKEIAFKCYFLERSGGYLLISREIEVPWKQSDAGVSIEIIKRMLARNQVLISFLLKSKNFEKYEFHSPVRLMKTKGNYKVPLRLDFKKGKEKQIYFFEIVRNYNRGKEKLLEKLKAYKEYYEFFVIDDKTSALPQLILVCEDDYHLLEIYKEILLSEIELKNMEIVYTSDLRMFENNINDSFVSLDIIDINNVIKPRITKYEIPLY